MEGEEVTILLSNRGKLLDSQALIISHRNDPDLLLADDVELFLIVFSSLAMRGNLFSILILILF